ncbi:lipopolysaccharide biosynthesis protein [Brevundimonas sp. FT23042]|uniref:lipopolysaccharide biosynthesis protein n=1 Tax=Brevundimonas sp. FT23042 TaxID=3393749 RepID=UPI003B58B487
MFALLAWGGPALLGVYGVLTAIELVAIYLSGFEFHTFTTRRYARRPSLAALGRCLACHRKMLLVSTPLAIVGASAATVFLGLHLTWIELVAFMVVVATGTAVQEIVRFIVLTRRPIMSVVVSFIRTASWQPLVLIAIHGAAPLTGMLLLWSGAALLSLILAGWLLRDAIWRSVHIPVRYLKRGLSEAGNYYLTANASVLQSNLERFVLQSFLGPAAVGVYAFFQSLASTLPALVQSAVLNLWLPNLLEDFGQRRPGRFKTLWLAAFRALAVSVVLGGGILVGAVALSVITNHSSYLPLIWMLVALLAGQIVQMATQPIHLALYGAHRDRPLMILSLGVLTVSLGLSIVLIQTLGTEGAVLSQVAGGVLLALARFLLFRLYLRKGVI